MIKRFCPLPPHLKSVWMIQKMKGTFSWEDSYLENSSLPVFLIYSSLLPISPYGKTNPCSFQLFILGDLPTCILACLPDPSWFGGGSPQALSPPAPTPYSARACQQCPLGLRVGPGSAAGSVVCAGILIFFFQCVCTTL